MISVWASSLRCRSSMRSAPISSPQGRSWPTTRTARADVLDPVALASWANAITVSRLLLSPLVFLAIQGRPEGSWLALALWIVLCASDAFDGWVARRRGPSRSGAFLDPLADKVLVLGAM